MSSERRHSNPGRREREARKRHRHGSTWSNRPGDVAGDTPLKLGAKKMLRNMLWTPISQESALAVAEVES